MEETVGSKKGPSGDAVGSSVVNAVIKSSGARDVGTTSASTAAGRPAAGIAGESKDEADAEKASTQIFCVVRRPRERGSMTLFVSAYVITLVSELHLLFFRGECVT